MKLPDREFEAANPELADQMYADAVSHLREMTRDHSAYPRVWAELNHYGAARNMYGLRTIGISIAGVVALVSVALIALILVSYISLPWWKPALAGIVAIVMALVWFTLITPAYVRKAADRYVDALLAVPTTSGPIQ